jgi:FMN phosphatase YigB (HAD superfamily)
MNIKAVIFDFGGVILAPPHEAVFVDDSAANVKAAAQIGIHAIHLESAQALNSVVAQVERLVGLEVRQ